MSSAIAKHSHLKHYRPDIDGLRALAVVPVILFHAGFPVFSGGFVGVDVFFVISGYLITTIILSELEQGKFSIVNFYERRARRILPALFFVMLCCLPFAWLWLLPQDMKSFSQSLVAVSLSASNILFWRTSGYFDTSTELNPMLHTWSLAVEEQYYIFFPIVLMLAWRFGRRLVGASILLVGIVSLILAQHFSYSNPMAAFYLLPTRAWELMIGALVAFYYTDHNIGKHKPIHSQIGGLFGLVLILFSIFYYSSSTPFPSFYTLAPTLGAALIIAFNTRKTFVGMMLSNKLFVRVGLVSYSAYLWHQPIFALMRHRLFSGTSTFTMSSLVVLSFGLAYGTWRYIERPFRNSNKISASNIYYFATAGSFVFIVLGFAGIFFNGYPSRFDSIVSQTANFVNDKNPNQKKCHSAGSSYIPPSSSCVIGDSNNVSGVLFGDSHADALSYYLSKELSSAGIGFKELTHAGCAPSPMFVRIGDYNCSEYNSEVRELLSDPKYKYVVLLARWSIYTEGTRFNNSDGGIEGGKYVWADAGLSVHDLRRSPSDRKNAIISSYKKLVDDLLSMDKIVFLVYPIPEVGWNVPVYSAKKIIYSNIGQVSTDYRIYLQRNADVISAFDSLGPHRKLIRITPSSLLCNTHVPGRCIATLDGTPLYFDDNHLSSAGAEIIGKDILRHLKYR